MKKFICLFIGVLCFVACKTINYQTTNTTYLTGNAYSISMRVVGFGQKSNEPQDYAELQAIKVLLFRGLPNSQQKEPLVSVTENDAENIHKEYFKSLFEGRYKSFIVNSKPSSDVQKIERNKYQQTFDIIVNIKALRADLESNGVIRKFGL